MARTVARQLPPTCPRYLNGLSRKYQCESAWNKDPVFGVIGIQSGPRDKGPQWLPSSHGSRGWDAGGGDDW